jgi:hypothetical protein
MQAVAAETAAGDLVMLIGARGMDQGARLLQEALS